jgi:hypothetical protein
MANLGDMFQLVGQAAIHNSTIRKESQIFRDTLPPHFNQ